MSCSQVHAVNPVPNSVRLPVKDKRPYKSNAYLVECYAPDIINFHV
jgi:hypothetical protein